MLVSTWVSAQQWQWSRSFNFHIIFNKPQCGPLDHMMNKAKPETFMSNDEGAHEAQY